MKIEKHTPKKERHQEGIGILSHRQQTPGQEGCAALGKCLRFYVKYKRSESPIWVEESQSHGLSLLPRVHRRDSKWSAQELNQALKG